MEKIIYWVVGFWLLCAGIVFAKAQTTTFMSPTGQVLGSAIQMGNITNYNNAQGHNIGNAVQLGNTTTYSTPSGQPIMTTNQFGQMPQQQTQPFFGQERK